MQDSILLVIKDDTLRRLYHGLLLKEGFEVIPTGKIEDGMVIQLLTGVPFVLIYPDDMSTEVVRSYLNLHDDHAVLSQSVVVLLSSQGEDYIPHPNDKFHILNVSKLNPHEIAMQVISLYGKMHSTS